MKTFLLSFGLLLALLSQATSYTSVMDGDWSSPLTWGSTSSIPLTGDQVTINHVVTLDDQYTNNGYWACDGATASITIESNGTLQAGDNVLGIAILNGGTITNNGQYIFPQLGNYSGTFTNNGTATLSQLIYNEDAIYNYGDILSVDSLKTLGTFSNNTNANLYADSIYVEDQFINQGHIYNHEITNNGMFENPGNIEFRRFSNFGNFFNTGSLIGTIDALNWGMLDLATNSTFDLQNNFSNNDTVDHNAILIVDGIFDIGNNFYNADTIKGNDGHIYLQDSSMNAGWFKETFFFCDATPVSSSPFIDYNTGTVESGVRYCTSVSVGELFNTKIIFFPNPAHSNLTIEGAAYFKLVDITGKLVAEQELNGSDRINLSEFKKGIYFISLQNKTNTIVRKLVIE